MASLTGQVVSGQGAVWVQKEISVPAMTKGCHLITEHIVGSIPELKDIKIGTCQLFGKQFIHSQYTVDFVWGWTGHLHIAYTIG